MNPSVGQILEAITAVNAEHVIVLPNNPNVRLAAENAAAESTKDVRVIATDSVPEGIAGAFAFDADAVGRRERGGDARGDRRRRRAAEITRASRDATVDGVTAAEGDFLAIVDGRRSRPTGASGSCSTRSSTGSPATGSSYVQLIRGEGAPERGGARAPGSPRAGSRST